MSRQAYVDHQQKFILFWSPKAGCSSLVNWFTEGLLAKSGQYPDPAPQGSARKWLKANGHWLGYRQAHNLALNAGYETFVLARHPVSRLVSAYVNKFVVSGAKQRTSFLKLEPFARQLYAKAFNTNVRKAKSTYRGISMLEFATFVKKEILAQEKLEPDLDHHWNTQFPFYLQQRGFHYDNIFYLEDMVAAEAWLNSRSGTRHQLTRENPTEYTETVHKDCTQMSSLELAKKPHLLARENFITPEVVEIISEAYEIDYTTFNYDPQDISAIPAPVIRNA